jgi:hypothetical protein
MTVRRVPRASTLGRPEPTHRAAAAGHRLDVGDVFRAPDTRAEVNLAVE